MTTSLPSSCCAFCGSRNSLSSCQGCYVTFYCGPEHLISHQQVHKPACDLIMLSQTALKKDQLTHVVRVIHGKGQSELGSLWWEHYKILKIPSGENEWSDPLIERQKERFPGALQNVPYMKHRLALVNSLLMIKTYSAVDKAREHLMKYLYLCGGENRLVRELVPAVDLRLSRDQECYDFCKWCARAGQSSNFDWNHWNDLSDPKSSHVNGDIFEPLDYVFTNPWTSASHIAAVTLLKIRILLTLRAVENTRLLSRKVPEDIIHCIQMDSVQGTVLERRKDVWQNRSLRAAIKTTQRHINELYGAMNRNNKDFWPALLDPEEHLKAKITEHPHGTLQKMQHALQQSYDAWLETPYALDFICKLHESFIAT